MSQYNERVALQRQILKAEKYVNQPTCIHAHRLTSMWYDNDQTVKDVADGVMDIQYMDGRVERTLKSGKKYILVEGKKGAELVQEVTRNLADSGKHLG
jgi:chaperone required for assembly of F1-ATPase|tara:strand:- start:44 stop:337 length:294 start_codon:yes stop_codon:yes gene_type:complete